MHVINFLPTVPPSSIWNAYLSHLGLTAGLRVFFSPCDFRFSHVLSVLKESLLCTTSLQPLIELLAGTSLYLFIAVGEEESHSTYEILAYSVLECMYTCVCINMYKSFHILWHVIRPAHSPLWVLGPSKLIIASQHASDVISIHDWCFHVNQGVLEIHRVREKQVFSPHSQYHMQYSKSNNVVEMKDENSYDLQIILHVLWRLIPHGFPTLRFCLQWFIWTNDLSCFWNSKAIKKRRGPT